MFLRFVKLLLRSSKALEEARNELFNHGSFTLEDSFALFDINGNGKISAREFAQVFNEHRIEEMDYDRLVEIIDDDFDGTVDMREWVAALKP